MAEKIGTGTGRGNAIGHVPGVARRIVLAEAHPQAVVDVAVRVNNAVEGGSRG